MITNRARAGAWQPGDPQERSPGGSRFGATGLDGPMQAAVAEGRSRRTRGRSPATADDPPTIRVVVVVQHDVIRAGLRSLIASEPGYVVVGEASNGGQAIEVVKGMAPDVVLMDVRLPVVDGIEAARRMRGIGIRAPIVLISTDCDSETLMAALRAGVRGYVLKDVEREELLSVIRRVLTGGHAIESTLATELLRQMAEEVERHPSRAPEPLTPREIEVLRLISLGSTNRQIASRLIVAVGTVKAHIEHIMAKLGAADRTQAAVLAIDMGIITTDTPTERDARLP